MIPNGMPRSERVTATVLTLTSAQGSEMKDLVIGIDSSTQSTKAIAWAKTGEWVAEGQKPA